MIISVRGVISVDDMGLKTYFSNSFWMVVDRGTFGCNCKWSMAGFWFGKWAVSYDCWECMYLNAWSKIGVKIQVCNHGQTSVCKVLEGQAIYELGRRKDDKIQRIR